MEKAKLVFEELKQKYEKQKALKNAPAINWLPIGESLSEDFSIQHAGGIISLKAHGYLGAIYGLQSIRTGIESGHLVDFLGQTTPHFKIRPIWLEDAIKTVLSEPSQLHAFCKRVLELGYNALVVDQSNERIALKSFCEKLQSYGLKVILKLSFLQNQKWASLSPFDKTYRDAIADCLKTLLSQNHCFDFLFWESQWQQAEFTHDHDSDSYTLPEMVLAEARMIENSLDESKALIFFLPSADAMAAKQSAEWMPRLADDLEKKTILAFSAVAGDIFVDYLPPHPFWDKLRSRTASSSAALMPILNIGHVKQSEGLWPVLVDDLIDEYVPRCRQGHFSGILAIANQIPREGGIHDCNLWTASQCMWKKQLPAFLWIETWFSAYRPDWNYPLYSPILHQIRALSKQLFLLRSLSHEKHSSQECRLFAESILIQLNEIQAKLEKEERKRIKKSEKTTLWDYFTFFAYDARRMVLDLMQFFNISVPNLLEENDIKESFWTESSLKANQGVRSNGRIVFLKSPNKGAPNSRMNMIYQENRLFEG